MSPLGPLVPNAAGVKNPYFKPGLSKDICAVG